MDWRDFSVPVPAGKKVLVVMFGPIKRKAKEKEDVTEKLKEQEETARVYAEFVKSFQADEDDYGEKKFVRGGVIDPNKTRTDEDNDSSSSKPQYYKPQAKKGLWLPPSSRPSIPVKSMYSDSRGFEPTIRTELGKGIGGIDGLTSNVVTSTNQKTKEIDSFLEEIKLKQELLNQRKQLRQIADSNLTNLIEKEDARFKLDLIESQTRGSGSIPGLIELEESSNLYLGNLAPEVTEENLCQLFGKYGVVTSVKIMYPRLEEGAKRRLCGFCSFASREMAEAAKNALDGTDYKGQLMKIGWGKAVSKATASPTPLSVGVAALSGLPLATVPRIGGFSDSPPAATAGKGIVRVRVPKDKKQKDVMDVVAQFIAEDGHELERLLIEKQSDNDTYRFLFETDTEEARYYRWRVYAFSQGDSLKSWRTEPFQIFQGGREWHPPGKEFFSRGNEKKSNFSSLRASETSKEKNEKRGSQRLDEETRDDLEDLLRHLSRDRNAILEAMVFCIMNAEAATEITECLTESLTIEKTPIDVKISRLYLLSDLLHNSCCSRQAAWAYRADIEKYLPEIFNHHNKVMKQLNGRLTINAFKDRVMKVIRIWEEWTIYPPLFIKGLEMSFLKDERLLQDVFSESVVPTSDFPVDSEADGEPIDEAEFQTLSKYPFWVRQNLKEWNSMDLSNLERLSRRRGLSVSPESQATDGGSTVAAIPSYEGMRQLLVKRLVECEAFWRSRQLQNAKSLAVLDQETTGPLASMNPRDLIQSVVADVLRSVPKQEEVAKKAQSEEEDDDIFSNKKDQNNDDELKLLAENWNSIITTTPQNQEASQFIEKKESLRQIEIAVIKYQIQLEKEKCFNSKEIQKKCEIKRQQLLLEGKFEKNVTTIRVDTVISSGTSKDS